MGKLCSGMTWSGWFKNALTSAPQHDKESQQNKSEEVMFTFMANFTFIEHCRRVVDPCDKTNT